MHPQRSGGHSGTLRELLHPGRDWGERGGTLATRKTRRPSCTPGETVARLRPVRSGRRSEADARQAQPQEARCCLNSSGKHACWPCSRQGLSAAGAGQSGCQRRRAAAWCTPSATTPGGAAPSPQASPQPPRMRKGAVPRNGLSLFSTAQHTFGRSSAAMPGDGSSSWSTCRVSRHHWPWKPGGSHVASGSPAAATGGTAHGANAARCALAEGPSSDRRAGTCTAAQRAAAGRRGEENACQRNTSVHTPTNACQRNTPVHTPTNACQRNTSVHTPTNACQRNTSVHTPTNACQRNTSVHTRTKVQTVGLWTSPPHPSNAPVISTPTRKNCTWSRDRRNAERQLASTSLLTPYVNWLSVRGMRLRNHARPMLQVATTAICQHERREAAQPLPWPEV
eukprot:365949-Chlamydomonas_euryale.AAC.6